MPAKGPPPAASTPSDARLSGASEATAPGNAQGASPSAALQAMLAVLEPLARLAVDHGIQFGQIEELVKHSFVRAAVDATRDASGADAPVSRLSVVTGIHRKEVKRLLEADEALDIETEQTPATELFTRWMTDPRWLDHQGKPRPLHRRAQAESDQSSFEHLARSVTTDVHPRTLIDELLRLGLIRAEADTERLSLCADAFVPSRRLDDMLGFLGANVSDHLAAARANVASSLRTQPAPQGQDHHPPFLEQALFADGLSKASTTQAIEQTRALWTHLLQTMAPALQRLEDSDLAASRATDHRIRIGLYCYAEQNTASGRTDIPNAGTP